MNGADRLLVTGLGPVGLAAAMLGRALGAREVIGVDTSAERLALARNLGLVDHAIPSDTAALAKIRALTGDKGCEASIDCSGAAPARLLALKGARQWGRVAFVGEGSDVQFDVSPELIHPQKTIYGSWVTSLGHMADLCERLVRWGLHPEATVTHRFKLGGGGGGLPGRRQGRLRQGRDHVLVLRPRQDARKGRSTSRGRLRSLQRSRKARALPALPYREGAGAPSRTLPASAATTPSRSNHHGRGTGASRRGGTLFANSA